MTDSPTQPAQPLSYDVRSSYLWQRLIAATMVVVAGVAIFLSGVWFVYSAPQPTPMPNAFDTPDVVQAKLKEWQNESNARRFVVAGVCMIAGGCLVFPGSRALLQIANDQS